VKPAYFPPVYCLKSRPSEWIVVIPVSGRLAPALWPARFHSKSDAEKWIGSEAGKQSVFEMQKPRASRSA